MASKLVDLTYILENVSDNKEFIAELLTIFIESNEGDIEKLRQDIGSGDHDQIRRAAHKIKSGFRSFNIEQGVNLLQSIEDSARNMDDITKIREMFSELELLYPQVKMEAQEYLKEF